MSIQRGRKAAAIRIGKRYRNPSDTYGFVAQSARAMTVTSKALSQAPRWRELHNACPTFILIDDYTTDPERGVADAG
jgi:hypothetical protein